MMIIAFVIGALVFGAGMLAGASIVQSNMNKILNQKDD